MSQARQSVARLPLHFKHPVVHYPVQLLEPIPYSFGENFELGQSSHFPEGYNLLESTTVK